jgi:hypothetical protein
MYNFGSPRVGNQAFTDLYNKRVLDSWRVTNSLDIVVTVPRWLGWEHVRRRVKINAAGKMRVQAAHGEDVFGQGRVGLLRGLIEREEDGSDDQVRAFFVWCRSWELLAVCASIWSPVYASCCGPQLLHS